MLEVVHEQLVVLNHIAGLYMQQFAFCLVKSGLGESFVQLMEHNHQTFTVNGTIVVLVCERALYLIAIKVIIT